jgi:hypothetical protein
VIYFCGVDPIKKVLCLKPRTQETKEKKAKRYSTSATVPLHFLRKNIKFVFQFSDVSAKRWDSC